MFDAFPKPPDPAPLSIDGVQPIHPILKHAIQDPLTPPEVRAVLVELQTLDPVDAALEARLLLRALREDELDEDSRVAKRQALRWAFHDWRTTLPPPGRLMSAERLAQVCDEWADAELAEII